MHNLFTNSQAIQQEILQVLETFYVEDGHFPLSREFYWHMKEYTTSGKLFRGCLLVEMQRLLQSKAKESTERLTSAQIVRVAAGLELICSGLLVHDDVMDHDIRRRGLLTTHTAMGDWAQKLEFANTVDFGNNAAICFGDVLFFLGSNCVLQAQLPLSTALQVTQVSNHELMLLGLAQAEDLRLASMKIADVTEEEIIRMQYGKTGRYTGRWPLVLAATLAGLDTVETEKIGRVGDELGLLYQWRDDYLGLFGDPQKTGKNVLSDVQEAKKTLYYWHAWHMLNGTEKELLDSIFGKKDASVDEVQKLLEIIEKSGVVEQVQEKMTQQVEKTLERIEKLKISEAAQELLQYVLQLIITREK